MLILERGMKDAGTTTDKEKVRTAIENIKGLVGTAGIFNFSPTDHNGLDKNAFEMLTVKNGKFVVLE
jgi:branched-chain amino acid transport system substrate-binding protein